MRGYKGQLWGLGPGVRSYVPSPPPHHGFGSLPPPGAGHEGRKRPVSMAAGGWDGQCCPLRSPVGLKGVFHNLIASQPPTSWTGDLVPQGISNRVGAPLARLSSPWLELTGPRRLAWGGWERQDGLCLST